MFKRILDQRNSLKAKLIILLLLSSLIPLTFIGSISYYSINSLVNYKIESGIYNHLNQMSLSLDNALNRLKNLSQQMSLDGSIGQNMQRYLTTTDLYEKKLDRDEIVDQINLISFSNPNLEMVCYFIPQGQQVLFPNYCMTNTLNFDSLPVLASYPNSEYTFYGPHQSLDHINNSEVLSIVRKVQILDSTPIFIYIETNVQDIFDKNRFQGNSLDLFVDSSGRITYSDNPLFKAGSIYDGQAKKPGLRQFEVTSPQGWSIVSLVPDSDYNRELNQWIVRYFLLAIASLGISLWLAWSIWRMVYRPLSSLNREILLMSNSQFKSSAKLTKVREFDFLLTRFQNMRYRIQELLTEVKDKEQHKASLEIEKLMYQINPHFIHNTLDTIRWLARLEGQDQIDNLISTLNKLLHYNLGKGQTATLEEEIAALRNYVTLQQIRYNFQFDVRIDTEHGIHEAVIPRFILQPLVENAFYHAGMSDDGIITVTIQQEAGDRIRIRVADNGKGMDEAEIRKLMIPEGQEASKSGLGIGIHYVFRMLEHHFGRQAQYRIESEAARGTTIILSLPYRRRSELT